jgi:hypothetical protein
VESLHACTLLLKPSVCWLDVETVSLPHVTVRRVQMGLNAVQGLPQLEPAIMDKLLWPSVPMLTSVHQQEEVARRARDALSGRIIASLAPLRRSVPARSVFVIKALCMHPILWSCRLSRAGAKQKVLP